MRTTLVPEPLRGLELARAVPDEPYRGLVPYDESDAPRFFGRERETGQLISNLLACRFFVVYGASGVGKTSVLRAGVVHRLETIAAQNRARTGLPELAVAYVDAWSCDPLAEIAGKVRAAVEKATGKPLEISTDHARERTPFQALLLAATRAVGGDVLLILDQFEEYLLYHGDEDGEGTLAVELPRLLRDSRLCVNVLVSIREDGLARLDRFKHRIPRLLENFVRLDYLDRPSARRAVIRPLRFYNQLRHPEGGGACIEAGLVRAVLRQVAQPAGEESDAGRGGAEMEAGTAPISTPYLQLVMTQLWEAERAEGSRVLRQCTLERTLGGARQIVQKHVDDALRGLQPRQREAAAQIFHYLVTPSGSKFACSVDDLEHQTDLPRADIEEMVALLSTARVRILRALGVQLGEGTGQAPRYQIYHDVLGPAVLRWRARYRQEQLELQEMARYEHHRRRTVRMALGVMMLVAAAMGAWVYQSGVDAREARRALIVSTMQTDRLKLQASLFSAEGELHLRRLREGRRREIPLLLAGDGDYAFVARCDEDCTEMGLRLLDSAGEVVGTGDGFISTMPLAARDSVYRLEVRMVRCEQSPCDYGVQTYHRSRRARIAYTLRQQRVVMLDEGFTSVEAPRQGTLADDARALVPLELLPGREYAVAAACDENCTDLQLRLMQGTDTVSQYIAPTDMPTLIGVTASARGPSRLEVVMANCLAPRCVYSYQVLSATPLARRLTLTRLYLQRQLTSELTLGRYRQAAGDAVVGALPTGGVRRYPLTLHAGRRYLLPTACGVPERDCTLEAVVRWNGAEVWRNAQTPSGYLELVPRQSGRYELAVRMSGCAAQRCAYGYRLFREVTRTTLPAVSARTGGAVRGPDS